MTPCARCNEPAVLEILTPAGAIPACEFCSDAWFCMELGQPIETFYGEVSCEQS